jgi:hypothetical protein
LAWYEANSEVKTFVVKANRPVLALGRKSPGETEKTQLDLEWDLEWDLEPLQKPLALS